MIKVNDIHFKSIALTSVLIFFSFFSIASTGSEEEAKKLFDKDKYAEALPFYEQLYTLYPNDAEIQYRYGVCAVETGDYSQKIKKILLQANINNAPSTVNFYIGEIYHATNEFDTALDYYNKFEGNSKSKTQSKLNFSEIKTQCQNNINPFIEEKNIDSPLSVSTSENQRKESETQKTTENLANSPATDSTIVTKQEPINIETEKTNSIKNEVQIDEAPLVEKNILLPENLRDTLLNFTITPSVKYLKINQFKTTTGYNEFIKSWTIKNELTEKTLSLEKMREQYSNSNNEENKQALTSTILDLELSLPTLKQVSDIAMLNALEAEINYWNNASEQEIKNLNTENDSILEKWNAVHTPAPEIKPEIADTIIKASVTIDNNENQDKNDNNINHIIYRVQIGAYSKELPDYIDRLYKKLSVLRKIDNYTDNRGVTVYTVGEVNNFNDAVKLQNQIRQEGVKDAFVVAYNNGKRISLKEAKELTE